MLKSLHIKNFAIIQHLELQFFAGLSTLTGETGAGKSIIIDAMGLVLGDRADSSLIRAGEESAEIILVVELAEKSNILTWMQDNDFDSDSECILRRVMRVDGKSRAYINGVPVPLKTLRSLGERIINIYGQHAHQSLMQTATQRQLLDQFAGNVKDLATLTTCFQDWQEQKVRLQSLSENAGDIASRIDLLRYQVEELDQLSMSENEFSDLEKLLVRLSNAEELKHISSGASHQLKNDESQDVYTQLSAVIGQIEQCITNDSSLTDTQQSLQESITLIDEAASELAHYAEKISLEPQMLAETQERMSLIDQISRKHKISPEQIPQLHQELSQELETLTQPDYDLETLTAQCQKSEQKYTHLANKISQKRTEAGHKLSQEITLALAQLGMQKAQLEIAVTADQQANSHGTDKVIINIQTNPGQKMLPLTQVASGGELSRISLAIQMIAVEHLEVPVLIFDEVDSGVGGAVAEVVGRALRDIGEHKQVMCITHLAQVAASAHHHYRVNKYSENKDTSSAIEYLDAEQRVSELARMIGGVKLTQNTYSHAQEMLDTFSSNQSIS
jgi:DNA repair protein RecN (Recombination protein N)